VARRLLIVLAGLLAGACGGYVAQPMQPVTLIAVAQRQKIRVATQADVLLVVDDSLSMSGKQQRLAQALQDFTARLDALQPPIDYRAGVVSTSVAERFGACAPAGDPFAAAQCDSDWGATGFVCDDKLACARTFPDRAGKLHPPQPGAPALLARKDHDAAEFASLLAQAVEVGTDGSRQPQGLEAMRLAVADPSTGFLRDGAKLVVAFFSDADDCSDPDRNMSMLTRDPLTGAIVDNCAAEIAGKRASRGLAPVSRYVNFLRSLTNADGSAHEVEIGAIVSLAPGTPDPGLCVDPACDSRCNSTQGQQDCASRCAGAVDVAACRADCLTECHTFCGGQVPGRRYAELAMAFTGALGNVCSDDASEPLARLSQVIGIPTEVSLYTQPEDVNLIQVTVERAGAIIDCAPGTGFDLLQTPDGPAVRFEGDCKLLPDDVWDVRYLAQR
jgi:hypothetical protein